MLLRKAFPFVALAWLTSLALLCSFGPVMAVVGKDPKATAAFLLVTVVGFLVLGLASLGCHLFGSDASRVFAGTKGRRA